MSTILLGDILGRKKSRCVSASWWGGVECVWRGLQEWRVCIKESWERGGDPEPGDGVVSQVETGEAAVSLCTPSESGRQGQQPRPA